MPKRSDLTRLRLSLERRRTGTSGADRICERPRHL